MGGGLMQLVAYGAQDVYLSGNPQITFFKHHYKRHTNFAIETKKTSINACFGGTSEVVLPRQGDLIGNMFLHIKLPGIGANNIATDSSRDTELSNLCGKYGWVDAIGHAILNYVDISIGGQRIDKQYGEWMEISSQLSQTLEKNIVFQDLIGRNFDIENEITCSVANNALNLYVPLNFWFNRNIGNALPLIALQYHEVKLSINWKKFSESWTTTYCDGDMDSLDIRCQTNICASLISDYIYLDTEERKKFAANSHEYLIDQVQRIPKSVHVNTSNIKTEICFNHPIKELVWTIQYSQMKDYCYNNFGVDLRELGPCGECIIEEGHVDKNCLKNNNFNYGLPSFIKEMDPTADAIVNAKLQFNGIDRMVQCDGKYFNAVQPYQRHTAVPASGVYVYSFALKPEESQPTGTANFSRIDSAHISIELYPLNKVAKKVNIANIQNAGTVEFTGEVNLLIWAVNVNILRIMSGMGGLAYSN